MTPREPGPPLVVPHMTAWDHEQAPQLELRWRRGRLCLADETPADRDDRGILWARHTDAQGVGRPVFGRVHGGRQRRAMAALDCQVCGRGARPEADGRWTWLVDLAEAADIGRYRAPSTTTSYPPICRPCLELATDRCPALRNGFAVLKVRRTSPYGVRGIPFARTWRGVRPLGGTTHHISYDDPRIKGLLATQTVVRLEGVTLVGWTSVDRGADR
ncbi:hypothetical protein OV450_0170 [Actinobacteria bacterium OV450]|nr:hypothetical protein OV450_0170 [Actinobacteria bacterium OV450]